MANPIPFPAPPVRTPFLGNPPSDPKSERILIGQKTSNPNVPSWPWMRWMQKVGTQLTSPVGLSAPATATSPGTPGQITMDNNFLYVCIAKNTWKRTALSTF